MLAEKGRRTFLVGGTGAQHLRKDLELGAYFRALELGCAAQFLRGHVIPLGIPNRNQQKTLFVFLLFILAFPSSTNRVLAIWSGLVWCGVVWFGEDKRVGFTFFFSLEQMASSELDGHVPAS